MYTIYKHTNMKNGRAYIGYTSKTIEIRWEEHIKSALEQNSKAMFHSAIRKFGSDNWEHEILDIVETHEEAKILEIKLIEDHWTNFKHQFGYGYNMTKGGDGHKLGYKPLPEVGQKISKANKGRKLTIEHSTKISVALQGREFSQLHKKHLSQTRMGKDNSFFW